MIGGELGDGFRAGTGVALQSAQAGMTRLGHQQRQSRVVFGEMGDGRVAQLMQRPPSRQHGEQFGGAAVVPPI